MKDIRKTILSKAAAAAGILKNHGITGIFSKLIARFDFRFPRMIKFLWNCRIGEEVAWWDDYLRTKGLQWPQEYIDRLDPKRPLQPRVAALLPQSDSVSILDVGAGPLTYLGKVTPGKKISITAVDPLAHGYNTILKKHGLNPIARPQKADAEKLSRFFYPNSFDLVFARNCIDHSYDPLAAICEMLQVVKKGCYVLMEHHPEEGEQNHWSGLHQWNFSRTDRNELILISRGGARVNINEKFKDLCGIDCEALSEFGEPWLIARLKKR